MDTSLAHLDLISLALLGLLGTGHCLGMCGPLVIAFPSRVGTFAAHFWYHLGRIGTYTFVGVIMGAIGGVVELGGLAHLQVALAALAAVFLLLFGLDRIGLIKEPSVLRAANPARILGYGAVHRASMSKRPVGMLPVGLIMGLLPCGLSFAAFARALPSGGPLEGGVLLASFGAGTLPGLLLLGTAASRLMQRYRALSEILAGVLMIAMAVDLGADVLQAIV